MIPIIHFNDRQSVPWASLEELFDKLFFLAVSGDGTSSTSNAYFGR